MKKILIMMASVGGLVGSGYAEVLFSSNFDGHNVAVDPSYVKDVTGQTTATVSWTTNGAVTAISDLSAITSGGGFVNQGTAGSAGNTLKVNYNLNNDTRQGYTLDFALNQSRELDQLTIVSAHSNGTGGWQVYQSDLTYTISGGTLSGDLTATQTVDYAGAFTNIVFDLSGTTLGAGTYSLDVTMLYNDAEGGAYATYDGITLETVSEPSAFAIGAAPSGGFITNGVGASGSNTRVASGNSKGQSFTLTGDADLTGFSFDVNSVTTLSDLTVEIYAASGSLPTGDALFSYTGTLPEGLTAGDWLEFTFGSTLDLAAGDYVLLFSTGASDLRFELNASDDYAGGRLVRNNSSSGWEVGNATDDFIFSLFGTMVDPNARTPASGPNIIFLLSDDQGWTDHSVTNAACGYQSDYIQTPNMERLAREGVSFTSAYAQPNCAPSRAALYSGQYSCRTGNGVYNVWSLDRAGSLTTYTTAADQHDEWIDESGNAIPIAKALYDGGYVTAHFGKFHVGSSSAAPAIQGYEYNYGGNEHGSPKSSFHAIEGQFDDYIGPELDAFAADYTGEYVTNNLLPVANGNDPTTLIGTPKHLSDAMGDAFISFMDSHRGGAMSNFPVYVQFNFYAPHTPIDPRSDLKAKYQALPSGTHHNKADYAGLVEGMDQNLGRILNYLDDPNGDGDFSDSMVTNTLVIFASDNGGRSGFTSNYPLRGHKGNHYQGGLRVPMIVRMPGTVPTNKVTDTMVHFVDLYPTILDAASVAYPSPTQHALDGESFWNHTLDPDHVVRDRSPIFYHFPGYMDNRTYNCSAVIAEVNHTRYKYIYAYDPYYNTGSGETYGFDQYQLYNLTDDVSETINLLDYIDVENAEGPNDPSSSREYWDYMLNKDVGEQLAGMLNSWLVGAPGDTSWNPIYTTYKSNYPNLDPGLVGTETGPSPAALPAIEVPVDQTFQIQDQSLQGSNMFRLTFNSEPGYEYQVQGRTHLTEESWMNIGDSMIATGSVSEIDVSMDGASAGSYYRVNVLQL